MLLRALSLVLEADRKVSNTSDNSGTGTGSGMQISQRLASSEFSVVFLDSFKKITPPGSSGTCTGVWNNSTVEGLEWF